MYASDKPIKILDQLYLGNFNSARHNNLLEYKISAVVCLTNDSHDYPNSDIDLFHIDNISENLNEADFSLDKLLAAVEFIDNHIKSGEKVLVHCQVGASRSPTVIIAYVMKVKNMNVEQAKMFVHSKAPHINPTFNDLLMQYYYYLN